MPSLYKFRPLASCVDFARATTILKDRLFWFSPLWEQNDSMEAIYNPDRVSAVSESRIPIAKMQRRICSFSTELELTKPLMWAHYAYGFKGFVIKIEPDKEVKVHPVTYRIDPTEIPMPSKYSIRKKVNDIITSKSMIWIDENEQRVIKDISSGNGKNGILCRVGDIKSIIIGKPYAMALNHAEIYSANIVLQAYQKRAINIINLAKSEGIAIRIAYLATSNFGPRVEIRDLESDDFDMK